MNRNEILGRVQEIFRDVLDNDDLILNESHTPNQVENWDSIANVDILMGVEGEFGVKFPLEKIQKIQKVSDIINLLEQNP